MSNMENVGWKGHKLEELSNLAIRLSEDSGWQFAFMPGTPSGVGATVMCASLVSYKCLGRIVSLNGMSAGEDEDGYHPDQWVVVGVSEKMHCRVYWSLAKAVQDVMELDASECEKWAQDEFDDVHSTVVHAGIPDTLQ